MQHSTGKNRIHLSTEVEYITGAQNLGLMQRTQLIAFADRLYRTVLSQTLPSWERLYNTQVLIYQFMGSDPSLLTTVPSIPVGTWGTVAQLLMCNPNATTTTSTTTTSSTASTSTQPTTSTTTARPANCSASSMVLTVLNNNQSVLVRALHDYSNSKFISFRKIASQQ